MSTGTATPTVLLERDDALASLGRALEEVRAGSGRVTLVGGEAGIGKTSVVRHFADRRASNARVLWGACEALFTPRPACQCLLRTPKRTRPGHPIKGLRGRAQTSWGRAIGIPR